MMCYDEMTFINFLLQIHFIDTFSHIFICPETMSVALFLLFFFWSNHNGRQTVCI